METSDTIKLHELIGVNNAMSENSSMIVRRLQGNFHALVELLEMTRMNSDMIEAMGIVGMRILEMASILIAQNTAAEEVVNHGEILESADYERHYKNALRKGISESFLFNLIPSEKAEGLRDYAYSDTSDNDTDQPMEDCENCPAREYCDNPLNPFGPNYRGSNQTSDILGNEEDTGLSDSPSMDQDWDSLLAQLFGDMASDDQDDQDDQEEEEDDD